jgi:hypothetical protein
VWSGQPDRDGARSVFGYQAGDVSDVRSGSGLAAGVSCRARRRTSFEVVDGELEVDGLLETISGSGVKTLVVPVATALDWSRHGVSPLGRSPGNADLFSAGRQNEKSPGTRFSTPGTRALLIDWALALVPSRTGQVRGS